MRKYHIEAGKNEMIYSALKQLIAKKEIEERRKISYRTISKETGISTGTLVRLCDFNGITKIEAKTIDTLCRYFKCDVGDLLKFYDDPIERGITDPWEIAGTELPNDFPLPDNNE